MQRNLLGRALPLGLVLGFVLTQDHRAGLLLVLLALALLALPGIGPSGVLAPSQAGWGEPLLASAAVLVSWWMLLPARPGVTVGAFAVIVLHWWLARGAPASEAQVAAAHVLRIGQYPVLLTAGGIAVATRQPPVEAVALWCVLMVAYPVVLHRAQVHAAAPTGAPARTGRVWRVATALALVALLLPLALSGLEAARTFGSGDPAYGAPSGDGGDPSTSYWGFGPVLDTSTRGELPDTEVLRVRADRADYWRAGTFDAWDGRYWIQSTPAEGTFLPTASRSGGAQYLPTTPSGAPGQRTELEQTFRVVGGIHERLYAAATPTVIETPGLHVNVQPDTTLWSSHPLGAGTQWTVSSSRPAVTGDDLRAVGTVSAAPVDGGPEAFGPTPSATEVPAIVPERVRDLAREITADATTTYDQVVALEAWLAEHIEYTTTPPPAPDGVDAVDQTLFVDRLGSCDQIASAFVILARAVGIPARVAVGFTPERFDAVRGEYVSLASNAHAWAEVWFEDLGWVGFDPTTDVPLAGEPSDDEPLAAQLLPWVALAVGVGVVALLVAWGIRRWSRWRASARDPHRRLRALVRAYERALADRTRPRRPSETLVAYAQAVTPPTAQGPSVALAEGLTDASFGPTTADLGPLDAALGALGTRWPRPPWHRRRRRWGVERPGQEGQSRREGGR